jgi:hypothetical protein
MSVKIMGQVWELDLPPTIKFVLLALADHADHDGSNIYPGVPLTAWRTSLSEKQVRRILQLLTQMGALVPQTERPGKSTIYSLNLSGINPRPGRPHKAGRPMKTPDTQERGLPETPDTQGRGFSKTPDMSEENPSHGQVQNDSSRHYESSRDKEEKISEAKSASESEGPFPGSSDERLSLRTSAIANEPSPSPSTGKEAGVPKQTEAPEKAASPYDYAHEKNGSADTDPKEAAAATRAIEAWAIQLMHLGGAKNTKHLTKAQQTSLTAGVKMLDVVSNKVLDCPCPADRWESEPAYRAWLQKWGQEIVGRDDQHQQQAGAQPGRNYPAGAGLRAL